MIMIGDDTYEYAITLPTSVAKLEWKPLLDDATWSRGPNYVAQAGDTIDVYPHFTVQLGTVKKLFEPFHSIPNRLINGLDGFAVRRSTAAAFSKEHELPNLKSYLNR